MSVRITSEMVNSSVLGGIESAQVALARTQAELSSGKSILEPSSNPYGASQIVDLQSAIAGLTSYEKSASDGLSWMNASSSALASMNSQVQRVRELVLQAGNGTESPGDLEDIADEVQQLTEGVKQDALTQFDGQYVFSGTLTSTAPYTQGAEDEYHGNASPVARALGPRQHRQRLHQPGLRARLRHRRRRRQAARHAAHVAANLRAGTPASVEALRTTDLKSLETNLSALSGLQAEAGSVTDQLNIALSRISSLQNTDTLQLSNVQDANIAKVTTEYSSEHAAFEAALKAGASIVQESLLEFLH